MKHTHTHTHTHTKFNLQDQKCIGVKVQERKRKYEEDKKNPDVIKAMWNEENDCILLPKGATFSLQ